MIKKARTGLNFFSQRKTSRKRLYKTMNKGQYNTVKQEGKDKIHSLAV